MTTAQQAISPKSAYKAKLFSDPWNASRDTECRRQHYQEWHHCYHTEIVEAEELRKFFIGEGLCDDPSSNRELMGSIFADVLSKYPNSCDAEPLPGYAEAMKTKYALVILAMRAQQGESLPSLTLDEQISCGLEEQPLKNSGELPILLEIQYRRCTNKLSMRQ